jgi:hypothetical protein
MLSSNMLLLNLIPLIHVTFSTPTLYSTRWVKFSDRHGPAQKPRLSRHTQILEIAGREDGLFCCPESHDYGRSWDLPRRGGQVWLSNEFNGGGSSIDKSTCVESD